VNYNYIVGVSAGSLNAGALGLFPRGEEEAAKEFMISLWFNFTSEQVYFVKDPFTWLTSNSILDDSPLRTLITGYADHYGMHRPVIFGTTDFNKGEFVNFN
jgi:predicted acylesterase/phospholipase RssA